MELLEFSIQIEASKEKVWDALWGDSNYREWTSIFHESSYAVSDWKEGSKILFLGNPNNGMYAYIEKNIPNEQMIFRHEGELKDGVEVPSSFGPVRERYFLQKEKDKTILLVQNDAIEEYRSFFLETFPKALQLLKQIAER